MKPVWYLKRDEESVRQRPVVFHCAIEPGFFVGMISACLINSS